MAETDTSSENVLRPAGRPARRPGAAVQEERVEEPASRRKRAAAPAAVPDDVRRRFVQVGRRYHFPDGARAFTDRGSRLTTPSENTEVIESLVAIAQARGWETISLSGTDRFRQEAWFQARLAGLEVRGYVPSEAEQERLVRAVARRREPSAASERASVGERGRNNRREDAQRESGPVEAVASAPETKARDRLIAGRLLDHGRASYRHEPRQPMSYFVKIETARGEQTLWGVDLERAVKESLTKPQIGEEVGVRTVSQDPVTVKTPQCNVDGQVVGEQDLQTHRNRWVIEKRAFFEARATAADLVRDPKVDPREAVKRHPELASTYLHLRGAEEVAAKRIRDPEDQRKFVSLVRSALADSVARGEPLQPIRLRDRSVQRPKDSQSPERARHPDRTR
jgi:hypothetical protein